MTFEFNESDRQLALLALGLMSRLRPGFKFAAGELAAKFRGAEMFEEFFRLNEHVRPEPSPFT